MEMRSLLNTMRSARDSLKASGVAVKYQEFDMGHIIIPPVLALMRSFVVDVIKTASLKH
jgi:phospholipase/carboxylesterase